MKKIHALLVGIDRYHPDSENISDLDGCVRDVFAIEDFLKTHFSKQAGFDLAIKALYEEQANRKNLLLHFKEHLIEAAQKGDSVLFYFSGHGSREEAPLEFHSFFPDKKNETLVLYDSRTPNGMDLADKELAALLSLIHPDVHILVCLDCCHSGSGTRGNFKQRQSPARKDRRTLDQYLEGYYAQMLTALGRISMPKSNHVLFSACKRDEVALEDEKMGLFTKALLASLTDQPLEQNYVRLISRIRNRIPDFIQQPQMEYYGSVNPHSYFLSGIEDRSFPTYSLNYQFFSGKWFLEAGAIQGLQPQDVQTLRLAVLDPKNARKNLSFVKIKHIGLNQSQVEFDGYEPPNHLPYPVGIAGFPLSVCISESPFLDKLRQRLAHHSFLFYEKDPQAASYHVKVAQSHLAIYHKDELVYGIHHTHPDADRFIRTCLAKISRWERIRTLYNPQSRLKSEQVQLMLKLNGAPVAWFKEKLEVEYDAAKGKIPIEIHLKHNFKSPKYFKLLYLSSEYGIHLVGHDRGDHLHRASEEAELLLSNRLSIPYPDRNHLEDCFLLIFSTAVINPLSLLQKGIPKSMFGRFNSEDFPDQDRDNIPNEEEMDWQVIRRVIQLRRT